MGKSSTKETIPVDLEALQQIAADSASRKAIRLRAENEEYSAIIASHLTVFANGQELQAPNRAPGYTFHYHDDLHIRRYLEAFPQDLEKLDYVKAIAILHALDDKLELGSVIGSLQVIKLVQDIPASMVKVKKPAGDLHRLLTAEGESFSNGVPQEHLDLFPNTEHVRRPRDNGQVVVIKSKNQ